MLRTWPLLSKLHNSFLWLPGWHLHSVYPRLKRKKVYLSFSPIFFRQNFGISLTHVLLSSEVTFASFIFPHKGKHRCNGWLMRFSEPIRMTSRNIHYYRLRVNPENHSVLQQALPTENCGHFSVNPTRKMILIYKRKLMPKFNTTVTITTNSIANNLTEENP